MKMMKNSITLCVKNLNIRKPIFSGVNVQNKIYVVGSYFYEPHESAMVPFEYPIAIFAIYLQ